LLCAYVVADIILIMTILLFCKYILGFTCRENINSKVRWVFTGVCMTALSVIINLEGNLFIELIIYAMAISAMLLYFYNEKIYIIIASAVWVIAIFSLLDIMSVVLLEMVSQLVLVFNDSVQRILRSIVLYIFVLVLGKIYTKKYHRGIRTIGTLGIIFFSALTIVDTFIVMVLARVTLGEAQREVKDVLFTVFILVILGLFLQLGAVILILMQRNVYKESQQLTAMYLDDQTKHYEYLENRETETKKFRHDLRDHMDMLVSFVREHKYDEFDDYVEKIHTKVDKLGNVVTVQNSVVDAILNRYYSEAINNDVKMEVEGKFPVDCKIENYDICTIFSNLLRNALEATMKAEEKWISVGCRYTDKVIVVEIANSFDNKAGNGKSKTHKADKNNHGFGLVNVEESIEKYNGVWYREQEDNVYKVTISFIYARMEEKDEDSNN